MEPSTSKPAEASASSAKVRPAGWPLARFLAVLLAGFVTITAAAVLLLTWGASLRNTMDSLNQRSIDLTSRTLVAIENHLMPAEAFARETVSSIDRGAIDPTDEASFSAWLMGGLATAPHIRAAAVIRPDRTGWSVHRAFGPLVVGTRTRAGPAVVAEAFGDALTRPPGAYWGEPVHVGGATLINLRTVFPWPDGRVGMLVIAISVEELSRFLMTQIQTEGWTGFILYGQDRVLAHPFIAGNPDVLTAADPTLPLAALPDATLQRIWDGAAANQFERAAEAGVTVRFDREDDPGHILVFGQTGHFGDTPWYYGAHTSIDLVDAAYKRAVESGFVAMGLVILAVLIAVWVGHRFAEPLRRAADAAVKMGRLELDDIEPLPHSRVSELDLQAIAFNQMADGLRAFSTYVPKPLVALLAARGFRSDIPPISADATILFTDIVGFTGLSEQLSAAEAAQFLNHHFSLLGDIVHAEGGIIDKYIGDSLMAFWAPPLSGEDGPERAVRAAMRMAEALHSDNRARVAAGLQRVRIRIGIHTGPALVGNIGAVGRVNYTIVGDTVNVAQRLEDFGRHVEPAAECLTLASEATAKRVPAAMRGASIGALPIRGREAAIVGWRIPSAQMGQTPPQAATAL